jgi:Spy/CpxP family protein refolding chaperone
MKRQLIRLTTAAGLAVGMIFAQAQTPAAQPNQGKAHQGWTAQKNHRNMARARMMAALNLSPQQKAKAKTIFTQARETAKPVRVELRQNREAMLAAVKSNDGTQIAKLANERGRLDAKLATTRGQAMAKFYQELTPAQRTKAEEMHARFQARMRTHATHRAGTNG